MRKALSVVAIAAFAALVAGCTGTEDIDLYQSAEAAYIGGYESLDIVLVVDNSISMSEEQAILSTSLFTLVNSLVSPLPGWEYPAADDVRVGIVTSDMGLSWGGQPYEEGDGWPGTNPCSASGDDGQFQSYGSGVTINLAEDYIQCDSSAAQCPTGWTCSATEPGDVGTCGDPTGDGEDQICPTVSEYWASTSPADPADDFAFQVACLSKQGTSGCGFEQQLQAAATAMTRTDQQSFFREEALLGVLVVSDEEDCSMEDGPSLFATDEIQGTGDGPSRLNIACGEHQEYLYSPTHYYEAFRAAKGGREESVVFGAIVGVPLVSQCQGSGEEIEECLSHEDMELEVVVEMNSAGQEAYYYSPACTRTEDENEVTKAMPGRRFVELAQEFMGNGYVYSICNADWAPAMSELASLIASNLGGTCFPVELPWDTEKMTSTCDLFVEYDTGVDTCPAEYFGEGVQPIQESVGEGDEARTVRLCKVPKLSAALDCSEIDHDSYASQIGWYYCVNLDDEDFAEACEDGLDNDADGNPDCDDEECAACGVCGGNGDGCEAKCKFNPQLTDAGTVAFRGLNLWAFCPAD